MDNILEYLDKTTRKNPNKVAIICEERELTFLSLKEAARKIGTTLSEISEPRKPIIVLMEKEIETICAFLGVVYSGCFYVNVNPSQPIERIKKIIEVSKAELIITNQKEFDCETLNFEGKIFQYEEVLAPFGKWKVLSNRRKQSLDIDPLYCNFTSGTTGVPKGVLVSHRSMIDFMNYFPQMFEITDADRIGNQAPFDFDVSAKDIFSCLKTGATMVIIPKKKFSFVTNLLDYIEEKEISTLIWAVSALCLIVDFKGFKHKIPSKVKKVLFSGEVMPIRYLNIWRNNLPETQFVNLYGPTEITCNCTYHIVKGDYKTDQILPIGRAFPNEKIILINERNEEITEANVIGEICVSGSCLALGYYNDGPQTAKKFIQNPTNQMYYERIYKSGDLGFYDENGNLFFAGRLDFQIKHMGHRIELEEIEQVLNSFPKVERACCLYDVERSKIILFYTGQAEINELKTVMRELLPVYMIPAKLYLKDALPLTNNGKLDRKQMKELYEQENINDKIKKMV
ncbi:amino acid adenylation domain-containing protein [Enterococcus faecalis]|uniref:amino acid adenylation domain-containing protein n=1 Tax=Enterococcus faecalis TaxID=1351 RepID=UPI002FBF1750